MFWENVFLLLEHDLCQLQPDILTKLTELTYHFQVISLYVKLLVIDSDCGVLVQILRHWYRLWSLADGDFGKFGAFEFGRHDEASRASGAALGLVGVEGPLYML